MKDLSRLPIWHMAPQSNELKMTILAVIVIGILIVLAMGKVPPRFRRLIVAGSTFVAGLFYVLYWLWPAPQNYTPGEKPMNLTEDVGFFLSDGVNEIANVATILTAFLLGLGAFSLLRIHIGKIVKHQKDWLYSCALLLAMGSMLFVGYREWFVRSFSDLHTKDFSDRANWVGITYAKDMLFDGMLQKMDSAMFSIIAFYIISAAYRAFRIRSVEATILLIAAFVMMLSLLPLVNFYSNQMVDGMVGGNKDSILNNLRFGEIAGFVKAAFQQPAIRGIDFGIGIGALAMGIRLWLSLEKQGSM